MLVPVGVVLSVEHRDEELDHAVDIFGHRVLAYIPARELLRAPAADFAHDRVRVHEPAVQADEADADRRLFEDGLEARERLDLLASRLALGSHAHSHREEDCEQLQRAAILVVDARLLRHAERPDVSPPMEERDADPSRRGVVSDRRRRQELVAVEDAHHRAVGAGQLLRTLGDQLRHAVELEVGGGDLGLGLHHAGQAGVLVAQRQLGKLARSDVLDHRECCPRGTRRFLPRRDEAVDPDHAAVLLDESRLEPVRVRLAGDEPAEVRDALRIVVRVRVARDRHQGELVRVVACDRPHRLVAVDDMAVCVQESDAERRALPG